MKIRVPIQGDDKITIYTIDLEGVEEACKAAAVKAEKVADEATSFFKKMFTKEEYVKKTPDVPEPPKASKN